MINTDSQRQSIHVGSDLFNMHTLNPNNGKWNHILALNKFL